MGRARCETIPSSERALKAASAAKLFSHHPLFKNSQHIACYHALKNEFDSSAIIKTIWQAKKECYLPVLSSGQEKKLAFIHYQYGDELHANRYGILQPALTKLPIALQALDLVITPLIAFDQYGHRLGTGGGYYDRSFAFLNGAQTLLSAKPKIVGLAYAIQEVAELPSDPWDIKLDAVVTEQTVFIYT